MKNHDIKINIKYTKVEILDLFEIYLILRLPKQWIFYFEFSNLILHMLIILLFFECPLEKTTGGC